jgi:hypothetical protein
MENSIEALKKTKIRTAIMTSNNGARDVSEGI